MEIKYIEGLPKLDKYNELRNSVGMDYLSKRIVRTVLRNTTYTILAYDKSKLIGMGRLTGDNGLYVYINEVIVHCNYQKMGVGSQIVRQILGYVDKLKKVNPNIRVYLFATKGKEDFYKKFGFIKRPTEEYGAGMMLQ